VRDGGRHGAVVGALMLPLSAGGPIPSAVLLSPSVRDGAAFWRGWLSRAASFVALVLLLLAWWCRPDGGRVTHGGSPRGTFTRREA
jgi:hypothetical protein